ncbi:fimbrial protein [Pseudomonas sp. 1152_12]|uniref:fimbrial protein n=1 Tax=Pseudomonas sp. 1152_12 TaxID=2604455 RepID=UPI0040636F7C
MKHSTLFISSLVMFGLPIAAQAECESYMNSEHGLSLADTVTVPADLPVGSIITQQPFSGVVPGRFMNCRSMTLVQVIARYNTPPLPSLIQPTEAPGVGIRIKITDARPWTGFYALKSGTTHLRSGNHPVFTNAEAIFYKTGPITNGVVPAGSIFTYNMMTSVGQRLGHFELKLNNSVTFVSPAATCDLATGDVNRTIKLPAIHVGALKDADYAGTENFELSANCTDASSITFSFSGTPAAGNNQLFANTGTAGGVALWLYSRIGGANQTIDANGPSNTRTVLVSGNRAVLPLTAAYHKNGAVSQGSLASTATVNITYN